VYVSLQQSSTVELYVIYHSSFQEIELLNYWGR